MNQKRSWLAIIGVLTLALLTACGTPAQPTATAPAASQAAAAAPTTAAGGSPITVRDPWARPTAVMGGAMGTPSAGMATPAMSGAPMATPAMSGSPMSGSPMAMGGKVSAAYMTISNSGGTADKLISATTDVAGAVELHTTEVKDNVAKMQQVQSIEVPANGEVQLKSGGYHIMLLNLQRDLQPGDTLTLILTFEKAGKVTVTVPVRQP